MHVSGHIGIAYEFFPPFSNPVRIPIGIFISYRDFFHHFKMLYEFL